MEAKSTDGTTQKRKRRWYQFSLRSLMIVTVVVAIPCAWLGRKIERKRQEREAVESLIKDGWSVVYDSQIDPSGESQYSSDRPRGPGWVRTVLGENFFSEAKRVYNFFDEKKGIKACTDAGLERIKELPHLEWVSLNGTNVTDVGLVRIKELTEMYTLDLGNTKVTDAGLEHIKDLIQLQSLFLMGTTVTDAGLEKIKGLTKLRDLRLEGTKITDVGLRSVKVFSQLGILLLTGTAVTDAGLVDLKQMTKLRELHLEETIVTGAGVRELQKALPNCTISFGSAKSPVILPPRVPPQ